MFFSEIARIQSGGKPPGRDSKFVDIYHEKPIRLTVRALVPVKEHPKVSLSSIEVIKGQLISKRLFGVFSVFFGVSVNKQTKKRKKFNLALQLNLINTSHIF